MEKRNLNTAAWRDEPPPDGLRGDDRLCYLMLRTVYRGFRAGQISREEGEVIRDFLDGWEGLTAPERVSLLRYAGCNTVDAAERQTYAQEIEETFGNKATKSAD